MGQTKWNKKTETLPSKHLMMVPYSVDDMKQLIENEENEEMKVAYQQMLSGMESDPKNWLFYTYWSVVLHGEKKVIGGVCLKGPANDKGEVEIGYGIDEEYREMGLGTEAVETVVDWAFSTPDVYYVIAQTTADNVASQHLLQNLHFDITDHEGEEDLVYEKERPKPNHTSIFMCLGITIGLCFGMSLFDNMALGICFGVAIGSGYGSYLDHLENKKRQTLSMKRKQEYIESNKLEEPNKL